jgi:hypothetical protein
MKPYPVHIPRDGYYGCDHRRRRKAEAFNRVAAKVERYINDRAAEFAPGEHAAFYSGTIAIELREDSKLVHDVVFAIDCGSNGVTVFKQQS